MNIEKWVILSSSHSPLTELLPLLILSFFSLFRTYANTTRQERKVKTQVNKKRMCRTWQAKPSQVLFSVRPWRKFPQILLQILSGISGFFRPPRTKARHPALTKTLQQSPFPWLLPQALGDSVKTGQREPMGLWVALSASVRYTVHTYRLWKTASNNKLKSPYGSRAEGDLGGDGMVHP